MIEIDGKIISGEVFERQFVCNLKACKGICCVEGDAGAPLLPEETEILEKIYPDIESFLAEDGKAAIAEQGTSVTDSFDGEPVTPLVDGAHCAYTVFEADGTAACGIENAWKAGKTDFRKPISCHLYPIRIKSYPEFDAVNYDHWSICDAACRLGESLQVPVYEFLKEALIRKYGEEWYEKLAEAAIWWSKRL